MYGLLSNGWIDIELFNQWLTHHLLAYAPPTRPVLLLLDGHTTHYQPEVIRKAVEEQVIVFCLPPHSSHITATGQQLFWGFEESMVDESHQYVSEIPGLDCNTI